MGGNSNQQDSRSNELLPNSSGSLIKIAVDKLSGGHKLRFPVYDSEGLLLLAEGSILTETFKSLLKARNLAEIIVDARDTTENELGNRGDATPDEHGRSSSHDNKSIDQRMLSIEVSGEIVRSTVRFHGCQPYDRGRHKKLIKRREVAARLIDKELNRAMSSKGMTTSEIKSMIDAYLRELRADSDQVACVANDVAQDVDLAHRCLQMGLLGMLVGIEMGLDADNVRTLGLCGIMHDWGWIKLPSHLQNLARTPSPLELAEIKRHSQYSMDLLKSVQGIPEIVPLVCYQVHERPNGTGFPKGRFRSSIHPFARCLNVVDDFLTLTSPQPNRPPLMAYAAMEYLLRQVPCQRVDADSVRHLLQVLSLFPIGSYVKLNDGKSATVLRRNGKKYTSPIVRLLDRRDEQRIDSAHKQIIVDTSDGDLTIEKAIATPGRTEISLSPHMLSAQSSQFYYS